jgi:hypothetical protein
VGHRQLDRAAIEGILMHPEPDLVGYYRPTFRGLG